MSSLRRNVHFVGVGGIGMSGLAEILLNLDYSVSGSDLKASDITARLAAMGMMFFEGHAAENLGGADVVVRSAAVEDDNVELQEATSRGIPILHRSDLLADLIRLKPNAIVVGGTHGKTTTTSMISAILDRADIGATSIVGGILHRSGTNARWGTGDCLVAEADEHDGSFLRLHPSIAVVTNIDAEHLEYYGTLDNIKRAFTDFCNGVPFYGCSIVCLDDANTRAILDDVHSVCLTYGLSEEASLVGANPRFGDGGKGENGLAQIAHATTCVDVVCKDSRLHPVGALGTLEFRAVGEHNVRNALAACAVGLCLGMPFDAVADGLATYDGVRRRLQVRGECRGVVVAEDYAHHPTEIARTLDAVRLFRPRRIVCVFQPHLFSRTKFLCEQFAEALSAADRVIVTDIYPSREQPMAGVDAGLIVDAAHRAGAGHVELVRNMREVPAFLAPELASGDIVLVLGAGDINNIVDGLLDRLEDAQ